MDTIANSISINLKTLKRTFVGPVANEYVGNPRKAGKVDYLAAAVKRNGLPRLFYAINGEVVTTAKLTRAAAARYIEPTGVLLEILNPAAS